MNAVFTKVLNFDKSFPYNFLNVTVSFSSWYDSLVIIIYFTLQKGKWKDMPRIGLHFLDLTVNLEMRNWTGNF